MNATRRRWRQRVALRGLARQLRAQDPVLAALLSGRGRCVLPPLRFRSLSPSGYVAIGMLLLLPGVYLDVGSAILAGLIALVAAVFRYLISAPVHAAAVPPRGYPDRRS